MQDETLWHDIKRREELRTALRLVIILRIQDAAPMLVKHIDYDAEIGLISSSSTPLRERFHAMEALQSLGVISVPVLLNELKNVDVGDQSKNANRKVSALIFCLIRIYHEGGYGGELARQRVELEAKQTTGKSKERLLKALESRQWDFEHK